MTWYRRSPRSVSLALNAAQHNWAPGTLLAEVQAAWPEAVGPIIAAEATPVTERGGVVTVSCSASVWAQELDLMAPTILGRLNARLGGAGVARLKCVATPPRR